MQHPTFLPRADGEIPPYLQEWCNQESIGMLLIRELSSVEAAATTMNTDTGICGSLPSGRAGAGVHGLGPRPVLRIRLDGHTA